MLFVLTISAIVDAAYVSSVEMSKRVEYEYTVYDSEFQNVLLQTNEKAILSDWLLQTWQLQAIEIECVEVIYNG